MKRSVMAALKRANRVMRPTKLRKTAQSLQKLMVGLALVPLAALTPKAVKPKRAKPKVGRALGAVVKQLQAASGMSAAGQAVPDVAKGAQYLSRTHRVAAGSRGYKLYIPARAPVGLVLMLHGCKQNPDDFAAGTGMNRLADKHGLILAYPAQTARHNLMACWNWFQPVNQARSGEAMILASLARKLSKEFGLTRDAVFVAGLSAGGAMAAILADVYPKVFAAAGIHSGLARGSASDVMSAMAVMRSGGAVVAGGAPSGVRRIIFQGDADATVHPSNAETLVAAAIGAEVLPGKTSQSVAGGRHYRRSIYGGSAGFAQVELWILEGAGHAWSGGNKAGSYTDAKGPDASAQMVRFFLASEKFSRQGRN